jgi:hypothetical protein
MSEINTTPYGPVDAAALRAVESTFETTQLFAAVDSLDVLRAPRCPPV